MISISVATHHSLFGSTTYKLKGGGNPLTKVFALAFKRLRTVDGIDEASSAVAQVFPGIGAPIVATSILAPATPFVIAGTAGAVSDCREQFKNYPDILKNLSVRQQYLIACFKEAGVSDAELVGLCACHKKTELLIQKYQMRQEAKNMRGTMKVVRHAVASAFTKHRGGVLSSQFLRQAQALAKNTNSVAIRYELSQYEQQEKNRRIAKLDRDFSVAGAAAMVGMSAGMFPAMGKSAADIAVKAGSIAAQPAAAAFEVASAAVFLPAQAAMAAYGVSKTVKGIKREQQMKGDLRALDDLTKNAYIESTTLLSVKEVLDRQRHYNARHSTAYGVATAVGQSFMIAGGIGTLSGVGAPVALPLFAVGVPLTAGAAGLRAVYEHRQETFIGEGASSLARQRATEYDVDALHHMHDTHHATKIIDEKYTAFQNALVRVKLFSLIHHVLNEEEKGDQKNMTAEQVMSHRYPRVEQMIFNNGGKKDRFHGTSLLNDDLRLMREIYTKEGGRAWLYGTTNEVQKKIVSELKTAVTSNAEGEQKEIALTIKQANEVVSEKILRSTINELIKKSKHDAAIKNFLDAAAGQKEKEIQQNDLEEFSQKNATVNAIYQANLVKHLIKQSKTDAKFLRYSAAEELVKSALVTQ